jgi:hypothetical protein
MNGERDRTEAEGGQGVSESAVSAKRVGFGLAPNRRSQNLWIRVEHAAWAIIARTYGA